MTFWNKYIIWIMFKTAEDSENSSSQDLQDSVLIYTQYAADICHTSVFPYPTLLAGDHSQQDRSWTNDIASLSSGRAQGLGPG